jgi:hypothetical protein
MRGLCLLMSLQMLTACTVFGEVLAYQSTVEYVESIFKQQNALSAEIMMLSDESGILADDLDELLEEEAVMLKECRLLNEYAIKEMNHEAISLFFKKRVKDSVEDCADSIEDVESLLEDLEIAPPKTE